MRKDTLTVLPFQPLVSCDSLLLAGAVPPLGADGKGARDPADGGTCPDAWGQNRDWVQGPNRRICTDLQLWLNHFHCCVIFLCKIELHGNTASITR